MNPMVRSTRSTTRTERPISTTETALTAHLVRPGLFDTDPDEFLAGTCRGLRERFGIGHATLQVEREARGGSCPQARPGSV